MEIVRITFHKERCRVDRFPALLLVNWEEGWGTCLDMQASVDLITKDLFQDAIGAPVSLPTGGCNTFSCMTG